MSCDYANGLSPYMHKGVLGLDERFDSPEKVKEKCSLLSQMIKDAKHVVVHTGAGISTSAGIPDFRGPEGVWTLEERGLKPNIGVSFTDARPTKTHMSLKRLVDEKLVHYIVSQNIDGLHLKSGVGREYLAELHGNMFIEQCNICRRQFIRDSPAPTVGQKYLGKPCHVERTSGRKCRGKLHDVILDWEHSLPEDDLDIADMQSSIADLSICLGTTLQIVPSGNLPLNTVKYGGKLVICNLQPTKHDNKADLVINTYVDDIFVHVMKDLNIMIPDYVPIHNPTSAIANEWTIQRNQLLLVKKIFKKKCDGVVKKRVLIKNNQSHSNSDKNSVKRIKKTDELITDSICGGKFSENISDIKVLKPIKAELNEHDVNVTSESEKCMTDDTLCKTEENDEIN